MTNTTGVGGAANNNSARRLPTLKPAPSRNPPYPHLNRTESIAKRPKVAIACESCRKRRSRCTGEQPCCRNCAARKVQCHYPENQTTSRSSAYQAIKSKCTELQARKSAYTEFFEYLRSRSGEESLEILRRVRRDGTDVESMVRTLKGGDLLLQLSLAPSVEFKYVFPYMNTLPAHLSANKNNPYLSSLIYLSTVGDQQPEAAPAIHREDTNMKWMYLAPYHAVELIDPRIDNVKASDWTFVTSNDTLVRELLRIYFTFDHSYYYILHKDHFLDDMVAGRTQYCSPLLVNTVLAQACHGLKRDANRASFWDPSSLGYRFQAEARRLWEMHALDPIQITMVQAAYLLTTNYAVDSIDTVGHVYFEQGISMARKLNIFGSLDHIKDPARRRVYGVTAWGFFGMASLISFHFYQPPSIPEPPLEPLPEYSKTAGYFGEVWVKYPSAQSPIAVGHGQVVRATCELRQIMGQIALRFFSQAGTGNQINLREAFAFRERLSTWYAGLPPRLSARNIAHPSHLKTQSMHYYTAMLSLFDPFASLGAEALQPSCRSDRRFGEAPSPCQIVQDSRDSLELLVRLYYSRHGFGMSDSTLTLWLMHVGNNARAELTNATAREDLQSQESALSTLILCVEGMREQGQNHYLHQAVFHMFKKSLQLDENSLLRRHITDDDTMHRGEKFRADHVQSSWPVNIISVSDNPSERELKKAVVALEELQLV